MLWLHKHQINWTKRSLIGPEPLLTWKNRLSAIWQNRLLHEVPEKKINNLLKMDLQLKDTLCEVLWNRISWVRFQIMTLILYSLARTPPDLMVARYRWLGLFTITPVQSERIRPTRALLVSLYTLSSLKRKNK